MTTVLGLIQNACYEIGIPAPSTVYASTDPVDLQLKTFLYAESRFMRRMRQFPQQKKLFTFATSASRAKYPLPDDFYAMSGDTVYDQTNDLPMYGPVNDSQWQERKYRTIRTGPPYGYRLWGPDSNVAAGVGGQIELLEVPSGVNTLSFEYISKNLFLPPNWTASEASITASPAEYRNANGIIYKCTAITTGTCSATAPSHTTGAAVDGGVTWTVFTAPYETIIVDEDLSLFDDDIIIHGIKWRYKQAKGQDYQGDQLAHKALIDQIRTRWTGSFVGGGARDRRRGPRYWVPYTNWGI